MKTRTVTRTTLAAAVAAALAGANPLWAALVPQNTKVAERQYTQQEMDNAIRFLDTLLNKSSVAQQIVKSQFPPALAYLGEAKRLQSEAAQLNKDGDVEGAQRRKDEAIHLLFEAGHLSQIALSGDEKPKKDYTRMRRSIDALVEALDRVSAEKGMQGDAIAVKKEVGSGLANAESAFNGKDYVGANDTLKKTYTLLRRSIEALRGGETLGELSKYTVPEKEVHGGDFDAKLRSVNALIEAQQRISQEKGQSRDASLDPAVLKKVLRAQSLATEGNFHDGMALLDESYESVRRSLEKLRGGETLVRSLNFATKRDEYNYELDRNDTYRMLIKMMVEDQKSMRITDRVQQFLDESTALRSAAEKSAIDGDYEKGIDLLERSTRSLIAALRNAGFFIPG